MILYNDVPQLPHRGVECGQAMAAALEPILSQLFEKQEKLPIDKQNPRRAASTAICGGCEFISGVNE